VVAKVRERLAVNKQRSHRFHMERYDLKKLNQVQCRENNQVEEDEMGRACSLNGGRDKYV
jgi:hypothetical protein